jgi:hypothetical protein
VPLGPSLALSVVPFKIDSFLSVVGNCIDADRWELAVRTLRLEVRAGKLSSLTARVALGRARASVQWLIVHDHVVDIPALKLSGEEASFNG